MIFQSLENTLKRTKGNVHIMSAGYTSDAPCQMRCEAEKDSSATKTIFSLTPLHLRKSNCKLGLFDNTTGDQKSGLPQVELFCKCS